MKRSFICSLLLILTLTAAASANAWQWWSSNPPSQSVQSVQSTQPSWSLEPIQPTQPYWPTEPIPPTQPVPSVPAPETPIEPIQPITPEDRVPFPNLSLSGEERQLINQVNQERIKHGLKPLNVDMTLVSIAKTKSHDMASNNYFSHVSPTLGTVYNMLDNAGVTYSRAGENIARTGSVSRAHDLFMNSSGHRANILHSGYTHVGVGIVKYGTSYHITQVFIKK